jgi:Protein of unknown function (DUF3106)
MIRCIQVIGLLALAAAEGICADQTKAAKAPPAPKGGPKAGATKGGAPKMGPRITNPASQAARLYQLNPAEREQALEKLPEPQQTRIREQLKYFDNLPKDQQEMMLKGVERFAALSQQERREFQRTLQAVNQLPPERRVMVRQALRRLQVLPEADRVIRLNSPAFKNRFTPEELHMIDKLSEVILPPM